MGFKINHRKRLAKAFGLSLDEVNELLQRMNGYFRKNGIDNEEIAKSFFILNDILHRKEKQRIKLSIPLLGFKSKGIEKYRVEIVKLDKEGLSPQKIVNHIKGRKYEVSLSTIKRYLNALKNWRSENV